jgi:hypothetical protein
MAAPPSGAGYHGVLALRGEGAGAKEAAPVPQHRIEAPDASEGVGPGFVVAIARSEHRAFQPGAKGLDMLGRQAEVGRCRGHALTWRVGVEGLRASSSGA